MEIPLKIGKCLKKFWKNRQTCARLLYKIKRKSYNTSKKKSLEEASMHLDHDHDETVHSHTHTHADGTTHTHTHAHAHDHENEHTHAHEDCAHTHCDTCCGCEHSPKEELMALMKYMVGHNASHANELANLAKQLQEMGETAAYDQIMLAVSDFEKGNLRLSTVLASMQAPNA